MARIEAVQGTARGAGTFASGSVRALPITVVATGAIALWLIGGVGLADLALLIGYELGFVLLPGYLVLRALMPGLRSPAWSLALASPIGLTLGILAFALTAGLGVRGLYDIYPLVVGALAAIAIQAHQANSHRAGPARPVLSPGGRWTVAGLCLFAFAYIGIDYFGALPLPGTAPLVGYVHDTTFHLALAADALHHWPVESPGVAAEPFGYHYFVHLHMAGIAQVTGIDLPVVVFRLYLVPLSALVVLQMALAGRAIVGRAWAGPLAAALFVLVRAIDASISDWLAFAGLGVFHFAHSPSQLLGLAIFIPILVVVCALLDPRVAARLPLGTAPRAGLWGVLGVLLIGAGGAKSTILPILVGGLLLYLLWGRLRRAPLDRTAVWVLGACLVVQIVYLLTLYTHGTLDLRFDPLSTIKRMPPLDRLHAGWPGGLPAQSAYWVLATVVGVAMFFGPPLAGIPSALRRGPVGPAAMLSVSLLVAGLPAFFFIQSDGLDQLYFVLFGLIAALPLSAGGLILYFEHPRRRPHLDWVRLALMGAAWLSAVVVLALLVDRISTSHPVRADLLLYGPLALAGGAVVLVALRAPDRFGAHAAAFAMLALLLTATLDTPLDVIPGAIRRLQHGEPLYDNTAPGGLRPAEYAGMRWIGAHTPADAVLSVSNDLSPDTRGDAPIDEYFPAFSERRTFREAWMYTTKGNEAGPYDVYAGRVDPFPERTALENAVFRHGDRRALSTMMDDYDVTHLVISKQDGAVNPRVYRLGRRVYSNAAIDVIELPSARDEQ